jgi:acyl-CoA synthetase (NDP forming)
LLEKQGYAGTVYPVNPFREVVQGKRAYPSIRDVPEAVDVAMVVVRSNLVPQILQECAAAGVGFAVVVSSGFGEGMGEGAELRQAIANLLAETPMRVIGPNCEGVYVLGTGMALTFSPVVDAVHNMQPSHHGDIAVVSQSGGLGFAVVQWGMEARLGFSHVITTGNEIDVDALEVAAELLEDPSTSIVVLLLEGLDPDGVTQLAWRARKLGKQIVGVKLGRTTTGARAALAHTLHDAGDDTAVRQHLAGGPSVWADDVEELIDVLQILKCGRSLTGRRIGIVGTSGGAGVWLADACERAGFTVPTLTLPTRQKLRNLMPSYGSPDNPVDLTAQFFFINGSFGSAVEILYESGEVDAVVLATSLTAPDRLERHREGLCAAMARYQMPLVVYSYTRPAESCVDVLGELAVPWYTNSTRVARALATLAHLAR